MLKFKLLFLFLVAYSVNAQRLDKPNVIVILADDLGWTDLSCYGSKFYETPNLDRLASQGVRFTNFYATSPVCSPTRSSILTGKSPVKTKVTDWIRGRQENGKALPYEKMIAKPTAYQLALEEITLAEQALSNGYKTFFAGKWHLGEEEKFWPEHQGFQTNIGGWRAGSPTGKLNDSTGGFFTPYGNPRLSDGPRGEYITDRLTNECIEFIDKNAHEPFLMYFSLYAVHNPMQAPKALIKKYQEKQKQISVRFSKDEPWMKYEAGWKKRLVQDNAVYAAMIENMDTNIGRILDRLNRSGLAENTLIIFTSDNGGLSTAEGSPTTNHPLRAGKGWLYEGGIRVPLIMYWKGRLISSVSEIPVTAADLFPTIAKVMDKTYSKDSNLDGDDIVSLLANSGKPLTRTLYWHYPHYSNQGGKPGSAIRQGRYKLIYNYEDQSSELYDLENDLSEINDLSKKHPRQMKAMKENLMNWLRANSAQVPDLNPSYDPNWKAE